MILQSELDAMAKHVYDDLRKSYVYAEGLHSYLSQTGEPYQTVSFGVVLDGGLETGAEFWHHQFIQAIRTKIGESKGTIYWRAKPEINETVLYKEMLGMKHVLDDMVSVSVLHFYCRFCVSDKEPLYRTSEEAHDVYMAETFDVYCWTRTRTEADGETTETKSAETIEQMTRAQIAGSYRTRWNESAQRYEKVNEVYKFADGFVGGLPEPEDNKSKEEE